MINRFANIFWHYYGGALFGVRLRLWPVEHKYSSVWQVGAIALYIIQLATLFFSKMPVLPRVGLVLILFSPQWLYIWPLEHPVFEYRGYGMAAGLAILIGWAVYRSFALASILVIGWACLSHARRKILTEPLSFWRQAEKENHGS